MHAQPEPRALSGTRSPRRRRRLRETTAARPARPVAAGPAAGAGGPARRRGRSRTPGRPRPAHAGDSPAAARRCTMAVTRQPAQLAFRQHGRVLQQVGEQDHGADRARAVRRRRVGPRRLRHRAEQVRLRRLLRIAQHGGEVGRQRVGERAQPGAGHGGRAGRHQAGEEALVRAAGLALLEQLAAFGVGAGHGVGHQPVAGAELGDQPAGGLQEHRAVGGVELGRAVHQEDGGGMAVGAVVLRRLGRTGAHSVASRTAASHARARAAPHAAPSCPASKPAPDLGFAGGADVVDRAAGGALRQRGHGALHEGQGAAAHAVGDARHRFGEERLDRRGLGRELVVLGSRFPAAARRARGCGRRAPSGPRRGAPRTGRACASAGRARAARPRHAAS